MGKDYILANEIFEVKFLRPNRLFDINLRLKAFIIIIIKSPPTPEGGVNNS
jgi:hypothetical protein